MRLGNNASAQEPHAQAAAFDLRPVDHAAIDIAQQIHAVQMLAYAQEAKLLCAEYFPPLHRTVHDIQTMNERFIAAFIGDKLAGAVSVCPDEEGLGMNISSLVVAPQFQRRGIARALMSYALSEHGCGNVTVQTGARNAPALSLYSRLRFVEIRRWFVGREPLELVKLLRAPVASRQATRENS